MKKWTNEQLTRMAKIIGEETTLTAGYARAAAELDTTPAAIRLVRERGTLGDVSPKAREKRPAPPELAPLEEHRLKLSLKEARSRADGLLKDLAAAEDELALYKAISRPPRPIAKPPKREYSGRRCGVPVMLCSDWHVEEPVDPAKVGGLNEYSLDIAAKCIDKLGHAYADMLEDLPRFECREGVIWLGGDLLSGYIHPELLEGNALSPLETIDWLTDKIEAMLRTVLARTSLERLIVPCNSGNHGRTTEKQRVSTREGNSYENALYRTLARIFKGEPRVEFAIAQGEWLELDVMGHTLAFTHGDSFNYGGGVGGLSIPIRRGIARQFQGRKIHQFCMGHFHSRQDFGDIQINGSLIGYGPYSQRIHAGYAPREQAWFMIDSERGKCLSAPIWFEGLGS